MWRVSDQTQKLLEQLHQLQTARSWFRGKDYAAKSVVLLEQIAEQAEPASISVIARCLFDTSEEMRKATCQAIHRILAPLPPENLLHLGEVIGWSWGWYISDAWDKLKPAKVTRLIAEPSSQTSLLGLFSFHRNGFVRHEAVRLLARIHDGSELPFLLIRQNDWVKPISTDAHEAIQSRLKDDNLPAFVRCLPLVIHLLKFRRHDHSALVHQVIEMLLQSNQEAALSEVFRYANRDVRREVMQIALGREGEHQPRVVDQGLNSTDAVVRYWCARKVRHCFSLEAMAQMIPRLQQDRYMPVRREGLSLEADTYPERSQGVWERALLDLNVSIRELARFHLQKTPSFSPVDFYRKCLATNGPSLAGICGLGETGDPSDLPALRQFLTSHFPGWRRTAVRGLAAVGKEHVVLELVNCLLDESPGVVREAGGLLAPLVKFVPGDALLKIVTEASSEMAKLTALRLIFEKGKWDSLPWLIRAANHRDETVATNARSFIEAWFTPPLCNRVFTRPSPSERQAIQDAISEKKDSLPGRFVDKLNGWMTEPLRA